MLSRRILILGTTVAASAVLYQQHTRLARLYPTYPATSAELIKSTVVLGSPAPHSSETWGRPTVSHTWVMDVPISALRQYLDEQEQHQQPRRSLPGDDEVTLTSTSTSTLVQAFAGAFWSAFPLQIEGRLIRLIAKTGVYEPFTPAQKDDDGKQRRDRRFRKGSTFVGGGFIVENDLPPLPSPSKATTEVDDNVLSGPLICRWGNISPHSNSMGGYHILSVTPSPASVPSFPLLRGDSPQLVRLEFTAHIVKGSHPQPTDQTPRPTVPIDIFSYALPMKLLMTFHVLYARILMDCTARNLDLNVPWF